ncbi:class I adenylate-forming enzyme family protein [Blastococcus sp. SYSU DS0539]
MTGYWPEGLPRQLQYPAVDVGTLHAATAARHPDRIAVVDGDLRLTFRQLHAAACAVAHGLRARGVRPGDVVALHLPNTAWFLVAYSGTLLAGAVVSPVNPLTPPAGLAAQLRDTGAGTVVTHPAHAAALMAALPGTAVGTVVVVPPSEAAPAEAGSPPAGSGPVAVLPLDDLVRDQPTDRPPVARQGEDLAHLVYTGGTTGVPKAVRVLHRNVVANVAQMVGWRSGHAVEEAAGTVTLRPFPAADRAPVRIGAEVTAVVSPLFHAHALVNANFLLLCGTTLVVLGRFSADRMLEVIERERVSYLTGSPTMWRGIVASPDLPARDLGSMRMLSSGAAPIDVPTLERMARAFPAAVVTEGYGLTEGTCLLTTSPALPEELRKTGSVGLPVFDTEVQIRGGAGGADLLPAGEPGRLWARGPQIADGYHGRPEATAEQFVDGWLDTGDIAYVDEDGFVFICDRAKDMLIYKGYNVYPRELEDVLATHPDVAAAAVVGRDDPLVGEEPVAFVVPRAGARLDAEELLAHVAQRVLPYKKLRAVRIVDALPTSAAGKIRKTDLRALLQAGS